MNAFRKIGLVAVVALVAVFALGFLSSSAEAGGCHSSNYGGSFSKYCGSYGNYNCYGGSCYPTTSCYGGSCYWPTTYNCLKPTSYPVTYYDCYGRPYVVWQTSYNFGF
jgi:hypothetical protein